MDSDLSRRTLQDDGLLGVLHIGGIMVWMRWSRKLKACRAHEPPLAGNSDIHLLTSPLIDIVLYVHLLIATPNAVNN